MKKLSIALIAILIAFGFVACNNSESTWKKEKSELSAKVDKALDNIGDEIEKVNNDIKNASEDVAESLKEKKENLLNQRSSLEKAKDNIANATEETWKDTKSWVDGVFKDVEDFFKK
jgi:ElaB/YqjD/DUF883 family membrane-anchored ribosome-binding protein